MVAFAAVVDSSRCVLRYACFVHDVSPREAALACFNDVESVGELVAEDPLFTGVVEREAERRAALVVAGLGTCFEGGAGFLYFSALDGALDGALHAEHEVIFGRLFDERDPASSDACCTGDLPVELVAGEARVVPRTESVVDVGAEVL